MGNDGILSGIRVLDLSQHIAGPYAAKLLADNGAEVIKIEPPSEGDIARKLGPFPDDVPDLEASGLFLVLNTSKKGITLDITKEKGRDIFLGMTLKADVVIESFRPGLLTSLCMNYDELSKMNPKLVMTSITDFGQSGPYRDWEATEIVFQAAGGFMSTTGEPDRPPLRMGVQRAQYLAGLTGFASTLAAIYHAQNTGEGQQVDIAIYDQIPTTIDQRLCDWSMDPKRTHWERTGMRRGALYGLYECQDGCIGCIVSRFPVLRKLADIVSPEFDNEERYGDYFWGHGEHLDELEAILVPWLFKRKKQQVMDLAQTRGLPWSYVANIEDVVQRNPHIRQRGSLIELEHPKAGKHLYFTPCIRFSETEYRMFPAPLLGQHNQEIFSRWLGLTEDDLKKLSDEKVI